MWEGLGNRLLSLFVIWVTAILCLWQRRKTFEQARLATEKALSEEDSASLREALRQLEDQKFALDQHSIVSIADTWGNITYVNDKLCEISKYEREELVGRNHRVIKSNEHTHEFFRELWTTISKGEIWKGEIKNRRKDGTFYWMNATIVPFKDAVGRVVQYVAIRTDITERREAEEELKRATAEAENARHDLEETVEELRDFNTAAVGRELRMIELKKEVNELVGALGRSVRYDVAFDDVDVDEDEDEDWSGPGTDTGLVTPRESPAER